MRGGALRGLSLHQPTQRLPTPVSPPLLPPVSAVSASPSPLNHDCCARLGPFLSQWWAAHERKKEGLQLRGWSQRVFYRCCTTGATNGTLVWEKGRLGLFICLSMMHVCCNEASLPLTCCHLPPTPFVAISLSSCDLCVLQWPLPRPLLCRLREATTPLSC